MIDLDHNATTRPAPQVIDAIAAAMRDTWHNPSSVHRAGQEARRLVELARASTAALIGAGPKQITFVSGGTEAIDLAIRGTLSRTHTGEPPVLVTSRVEHSAVRELAEQLERDGTCRVRWWPVDTDGKVLLDRADDLLRGATIASIQWANNETGVIHPVEAVAAACRQHGVTLHVDATQWVGKMPTNVAALGADLLTFAPHKFHGPKGVGVLWQRPGVKLKPTLVGSQEGGRRGGTENVPGIVGCGVACDLAAAWLASPEEMSRLARLRDEFEARVLAACQTMTPGVAVNGSRSPRLWNTSNIAFPRLEAEAILLALSERGVMASAGAACSSGSLEPSPVLLAMGVPEKLAHGSIRFSIGRETTADDLQRAASIVAEAVTRVAASMHP